MKITVLAYAAKLVFQLVSPVLQKALPIAIVASELIGMIDVNAQEHWIGRSWFLWGQCWEL